MHDTAMEVAVCKNTDESLQVKVLLSELATQFCGEEVESRFNVR